MKLRFSYCNTIQLIYYNALILLNVIHYLLQYQLIDTFPVTLVILCLILHYTQALLDLYKTWPWPTSGLLIRSTKGLSLSRHLLIVNRLQSSVLWGTFKGIISHGLCICRSTCVDLHAYSDSNWSGCLDDWCSTTSYCVFHGSKLISRSSKKENTVTLIR